MTDIRPMTSSDSCELEAMIQSECPEYMLHFVAFSRKGDLQRHVARADRDVFFSLIVEGKLAGFFCLRGLDAGYSRPSFGVYVSSCYQGRGIASLALEYSMVWCREHGITRMMLKVAKENERARQLYERAGFSRRDICHATGHIVMDRNID
jgi:RimJ/RimL family protein N-acetyltransferase